MRNGKNVNCEICKIEFYIQPSRFRNKHHCCSIKCGRMLSSILYSKKVKTTCVICNKIIFYKQRKFKDIMFPSCSTLCASKVRSIIYTKDSNSRSLKLNELERYFNEKVNDCKRRANQQNLKFDLDYKFMVELYNKQQGKCHYSKIFMKLKSDSGKNNADYNVLSVDKVIPELGYIKTNVVLCLYCINMLKSNYNLSDIKYVIEQIQL